MIVSVHFYVQALNQKPIILVDIIFLSWLLLPYIFMGIVLIVNITRASYAVVIRDLSIISLVAILSISFLALIIFITPDPLAIPVTPILQIVLFGILKAIFSSKNKKGVHK